MLFIWRKTTISTNMFILPCTLAHYFSELYHIAHHFSFNSCLAKLLWIKITNFYEQDWLLIFKMEAQRYEGWWKFSIFILVFYFHVQLPKYFFLCFLAVLRRVLMTFMKKILELYLPSWGIISVLGSLCPMQQHLPNYFFVYYVKKCYISAVS